MRDLHLPWWLGCGAVALFASAVARDPYTISVINLVAISALMAASLRFVMLIGEVSFASAAFVGLGAYSAGVASTLLGWPFPFAILLGPALVSVASVLFGVVTLRIKGPYFMLIGFAFAEAVRILFSKTDFIGGTSGMIGIFPPQALDASFSAIVMMSVLVCLFGLYAVEKSDFGKVLAAIRDNENIARTVGINVLFSKVACFAIGSACAGLSGSLLAFTNNVISPGDFSFLLASFALAYVKVGGESSIVGPIAGAIVLVLLGSYALGLGGLESIFYGGAIVLAVLLMPNGLVGFFMSARRRLLSPSRPASGAALERERV